MVKKILLVYNDDDWNNLNKAKEGTGLKWEDFFLLTFKCATCTEHKPGDLCLMTYTENGKPHKELTCLRHKFKLDAISKVEEKQRAEASK